MTNKDENSPKNEFGELLKYTIIGYIAAIFSGFILDSFGFQKSGIGQWFVRTLSGEGESIFEGIYAIKKRLSNSKITIVEIYGWGKFLGMIFPWLIDWISRQAGINFYGIEGFYIPYFYALSDQIVANILGAIFIYKKQKNFSKAFFEYFKNPVMLSSLLIILIVPIGLLTARLIGFSPKTQTLTALETIASNLCWLPPLIGYFKEKKEEK